MNREKLIARFSELLLRKLVLELYVSVCLSVPRLLYVHQNYTVIDRLSSK
jgi:hypothetical protein